MARALFKSWFVDFDPVLESKSEEKIARNEGDTCFPNSFQNSELGHIPAGWTVASVGDVVTCLGGATPSTSERKYWGNGIHHWTTPKDFSSHQAPILIDTERRITDAGVAKISSGLLPAGTLLMSSRAPVGYLAINAIPVAINQGFIAMMCNERASNYFMLNWCQQNMAEIEGRATGTTFAEISKQNFRPIPIVLPPKELMAAFTEKVAPFYAQITANLHQSRTLTALRDTLLPKLLSGELSVADARAVNDDLAFGCFRFCRPVPQGFALWFFVWKFPVHRFPNFQSFPLSAHFSLHLRRRGPKGATDRLGKLKRNARNEIRAVLDEDELSQRVD